MDKKKIAYRVLIVIALILGYFNYFGKEKKIEKGSEVVETKGATYDTDGYHIEAEVQKDYIDQDKMESKKSIFEKAKATLDGMILTGDNAVLDASKNLLLKSNILGKSISGWTIKTDEAEYKKDQDLIKSTKGVTAINKEKEIEIYGKNFTSDTKMENVNLMGDIKFTIKGVTLSAEKATYSEKNKIVDILGKAHLVGEKIGEVKGSLSGEFEGLKYDANTNLLVTEMPYVVKYNDITLHGENLKFNNKTEAFEITKNVYFEVDGYKIDLISITSNGGDEIYFNGPIKGSNGINSFKGDGGVYNKITKKFVIKGNLEAWDNKGGKVVADYAVYSTDKKEIEIYSDNQKDIIYKSPTEYAVTKNILYKTETQEVFLKNGYSYKSNKYDTKGKELYYNKETGDGQVKNGYAKDLEKNQMVSGDDIRFNDKKNNYIGKGKAHFEDKDYIFDSEEIEYLEEKGFAYLPVDFKVTRKASKDEFYGKKADYNIKEKLFKTYGEFTYLSKDQKITGVDLEFDQKTGIGKIKDKLKAVNTKDGSTVESTKGEFKDKEYVKLPEKIVLKTKGTTVYGNSAEYKMKKNLVFIPGEITFENKEKNSSGKMYDGTYYTEQKLFVGKNFQGKDMKNSLKSDIIKYYVDSDKFLLENNVVVKDEKTELTGNKFEYKKTEEIAKAITPFKVKYMDYTVTGNDGTINLKTNILNGNNIKVVSKLNEEFRGDKVSGTMTNMNLDFSGNVSGKVYQDNIPTYFNGDFVRGYFAKNAKGETKVQRVEIRKNAVIRREESTLYSDYLEIQPEQKRIYGKDNTRGVMKDKKGNITEVTADIVHGDMTTEIIDLVGKVKVVRKDKKKTFVGTSQRAKIKKKENLVEMMGNVRIDDGETVVTADKATYNTVTEKIKASGNVFVDYKAVDNKQSKRDIKRVNESYNQFMRK